MQLSLTFSTTVSTIGYDPSSRELTLGFLNGGTYIYLGVSTDTYLNLVDGLYKGEHIYTYIKEFPYKPGPRLDNGFF